VNGGPGRDSGEPPAGATRIRGAFGAFGKVTAVSGSGFTVSATVPKADASSSSTPSTEQTTVTVTVDGSTTYTTDGPATPADVKVGVCLRAQGTVDSTGAVTAKTVALSTPTDGQCGAVFVRRGPGEGAGGGAAGTTSRES
jgi:hypothetical protein